MDWLRSCYSTDCRFFQDDPRVSTIHWYFVDEDTPVLPIGTLFTSNEWLDVPEGDQVLGEVPGAVRTWQNGRAPYPVDQPGADGAIHYCGTQEDFMAGGFLPQTAPPLNVFGGLACCPLPQSPFLHFDCVNCPAGAFDVYTLLSPPIPPTNPLAGLPDAQTETYVSHCVWDFTYFELTNNPFPPHNMGKWQFEVRPNGVVAGVQLLGGPFHELYGPVAWDCNALVSLPRNAAGATLGVVTPVVIVPGLASGVGQFCPTQGAFVPTSLGIRVVRAGVAIVSSIVTQIIPITQFRPCQYRGVCWFSNTVRVLQFQLGRDCVLGFLPGGLIELDLVGPRGEAIFYSATVPVPWDLSPVALMLEPGGPWFLGLPQSVTLFAQGDLP